MTLPYGTPPRPRRRPIASTIMAGIAIAMLADVIAVGGFQDLKASWANLSPTIATPSPSVAPAPGPALPTIDPSPSPSPTGTPTASPWPTTGKVPVTDALKRGIVLIEATDSQFVSRGTGMILTSSGQILTNYHVVRSSTTISVTIASSGRKYTASLLGRSASRDVALLQLASAKSLPTITPDVDPVRVNDPVVAAGNASGQGYITAFAGRILALNQSIRVKGSGASDPEESLSGLLETDAHAEPGDSGGPLFDRQDEVTGMTTAGSGTSGASVSTVYAVPIANALAVVEQVRANNESDGVVIGPKGALGVNVRDGGRDGVAVASVVSGGPAAKAGLKAGDTITGLAGVAMPSIAALSKQLDALQPGTVTTIEWRTSGGAVRQASVVLDASKIN